MIAETGIIIKIMTIGEIGNMKTIEETKESRESMIEIEILVIGKKGLKKNTGRGITRTTITMIELNAKILNLNTNKTISIIEEKIVNTDNKIILKLKRKCLPIIKELRITIPPLTTNSNTLESISLYNTKANLSQIILHLPKKKLITKLLIIVSKRRIFRIKNINSNKLD